MEGDAMTTTPDPKHLRLGAERLRQVAKVTQTTVDRVPGAALFLEGDSDTLREVAEWMDKVAEGQAEP
jgi:hypothetical protein